MIRRKDHYTEAEYAALRRSIDKSLEEIKLLEMLEEMEKDDRDRAMEKELDADLERLRKKLAKPA